MPFETSYRQIEKLSSENITLKDRLDVSQERCHQLGTSLEKLQKSKQIMKADYESKLAEKEAVIKELKNEPGHLHAIAGHDGTNTGIPTSQTPIRKEKVIPNSRKATGKKRGGQVGHQQHVLESFAADEITECETHEITTEVCGGREGTDFSDTNILCTNVLLVGHSFMYPLKIGLKSKISTEARYGQLQYRL